VGVVDCVEGEVVSVIVGNGFKLMLRLKEVVEEVVPGRLHSGSDFGVGYKLLNHSGRGDFDGCVDLHGMSVEVALAALERAVDRAMVLNHRLIKVIHGKGRGILRTAIREYVRRSAVLAFADDFMEDMNGGATLIRIRD
jgi:DNA-nicking Smr family endonuclease